MWCQIIICLFSVDVKKPLNAARFDSGLPQWRHINAARNRVRVTRKIGCGIEKKSNPLKNNNLHTRARKTIYLAQAMQYYLCLDYVVRDGRYFHFSLILPIGRDAPKRASLFFFLQQYPRKALRIVIMISEYPCYGNRQFK